jgi:hypothetical protein
MVCRMLRRTSQNPPLPSTPVLQFVLTAWLTMLAASCRNRSEQTIIDSEGRSFLSRCSADRICELTQQSGPVARPAAEAAVPQPDKSGPKTPGATAVLRLHSTGRVFGVCGPVASDAEPAPSDCRPVVCESDADCPAAEGLRTGVCISRLCTEPSHAINVDDSVMLCLAGTGLGTRTAIQVERLALGLNCGTPCRIPKPCRQP